MGQRLETAFSTCQAPERVCFKRFLAMKICIDNKVKEAYCAVLPSVPCVCIYFLRQNMIKIIFLRDFWQHVEMKAHDAQAVAG